MTNKKLKLAAMSVALTACVAAQPLAANAADDPGEAQNPTAKVTEGENANANSSTEGGENTNANGSTEGGEKANANGGTEGGENANANGGTEGGENPNANGGEETTGKDETGKKTETPAGVNQQGKNPEDLLGDKDVNYDHENPPTTNEDGSTTVKGTVTDTTTGGTTGSGTETGSTGTDQGPTEQGPTDQGPTEIKPTEKDPNPIGTADKTEKDNKDTTTETNPKENAKPEVDPDKSSSSETKEDGTIVISTPTRVPATEETASTGSGEANAKLDEVEKPKQDFSEDQEKLKEELQKELGNTLPGWETKDGDRFGAGKDDSQYHVVGDGVVSEDGNSKQLTLKKTTETKTDMTAEDIAKLLEAEATTPDENGNYTLTRDKVEGVDKDGRKFTRITYITVEPNSGKVTTRTETTLVVTVEKGEGSVDNEDESIIYPDKTTVKDGKNEYTIDLKDLLKDKNIDPANLPDEIQLEKDGKIYTITFGEEDEGTTIDYSAEDLVKMLGTNYIYKNNEIYYVGDGGETKLTKEKAEAIKKSLSIKIKITDPKGSSTSGETFDKDEKAEAEAKAKLKAIKAALIEAAKKEKLTIAEEDITLTEEDKWTYTDETGKTYTFTYKVDDEVTAGGKTESTVTIIDTTTNREIDKVWDNTVKGTAYVTGSTITSKGDTTHYESGTLGKDGWDLNELGSDFKTAPDGAKDVKREGDSKDGRIISYVKNGKTYTLTYHDVDFSSLSDTEKTKLREEAKKTVPEGFTLDDEMLAKLTQVDWEILSNAAKEEHNEDLSDQPVIKVTEDGDHTWSQEENNGKYDFTYTGGSAKDMTLTDTSTSEDGKTTTQTFTKTDKDGTVTTITVTTRKMLEDELIKKFNVQFGENNYKLDTDNHTVTYTKDKKTYTAKYDDSVQTLNVEVKAPQEVAGTGNSEQAAIDNFIANLKIAAQKAQDNGETLIVKDPSGKLPDLEIKPGETTWEKKVTGYVKHVVNFKAMSDADLVNYLTKLKEDAKDTSYSGSKRNDTLYYVEGNTTYRVTDTKTKKNRWGEDVITEVFANGAWHKVQNDWWSSNIQYGPNYIGHLDLATDSKLQDEDGGLISGDCVLTEKTLEWNKNANNLVNNPNSNHKVGLLDRITYDNENDNDPETGHYEYPRASWDNGEKWRNNAPTESAYYKVTGKVSYGKCGDAFEATATGWDWRYGEYFTEEDYARAKAAADAALEAYKIAHANDGMDLSKAKVVEIYKDQSKNGERYYQIYLYESNLTAYGYLSDSSNTCGNAHYNAQDRWEYVGGFDLTLGNLTQVSKEEIVAVGKKTFNCSATLTRIKKTLDQANKDLTYTNTHVKYTEYKDAQNEGSGSGLTGSYQASYTKETSYEGEDKVKGEGSDAYTSYEYTDYETTETEETVTATHTKNFIHLIRSIISRASKTETEKKSANVKYTYTTVETRDSYLPGDDQITIITPEDPEEPKTPDDDGPVTPEQPELPPVQDATPDEVVEPETPVLPPVQDATPDAVILPAAPELPPVQDATVSALPQTGVNWLTAFGMACSGFALMVAGAFTSLKYKEKH